MTRLRLAVLTMMLVAGPVEAQKVSPLVKYGKWLVLAGSAGMNYFAIRAHNQAENAFDALESRCFEVRSRCDLGPDGRYVDPEIEGFYQNSLRYDRIARGWLIAGESALAAAAALFIWELAGPKGRPDNIPFEPEIRSMPWGTGLGLRVSF
jgi:hypothetical protein